MIEIQVAGAGAGKTYGMAKKIIEQYNPKSHKDIFAITYTNAAVANIEEKVIEKFGFVPDTIRICTVHTFLLNEIIYPFAPSILGQIYTTSARCALEFKSKDGKPKSKIKINQERNVIVRSLKKKQVIHVEDVYQIARKIVDPSHSAHNSKAKKKPIYRVLDILDASIEKIFLDEAQDLNDIALKAFSAIGEHAVDIYMVGDPKQSIKYPTAFNEFLGTCNEVEHIVQLPPINESRRVPQKILDLSNQFCPEGQEQVSVSTAKGRLLYIESSDKGYEEFVNQLIESDNLVSIYSKACDYSTRSSDSIIDIHPDINELLVKHNPEYDDDLIIGAASYWLARNCVYLSASTLINQFRENFKIPNSKKTYAQLRQSIDAYGSAKSNTAKYHISSIARTKGLEADASVIVLTKGIYKYLVKDKLKVYDRYNKIWNLVYVALTRARADLIIAIDEQIIYGKPSKEDVISELEKLGFVKLDLQK